MSHQAACFQRTTLQKSRLASDSCPLDNGGRVGGMKGISFDWFQQDQSPMEPN